MSVKLINTSPFPLDIPSLGLAAIEPGDEFEVPSKELAANLIDQGHAPATKAAAKKES